MRKALLSLIIIFSSFVLSGQNKQSYDSLQISSNQRILNNLAGLPQGITLGGYGEVLYNKPENLNAEIDIQRLVLLFGYKFDERVQFVTEIEFEHVKEVYVEQAFVNYNLTQGLRTRPNSVSQLPRAFRPIIEVSGSTIKAINQPATML